VRSGEGETRKWGQEDEFAFSCPHLLVFLAPGGPPFSKTFRQFGQFMEIGDMTQRRTVIGIARFLSDTSSPV